MPNFNENNLFSVVKKKIHLQSSCHASELKGKHSQPDTWPIYQRERIGITKENIVSIKGQQSNDGDETPEMFNFFMHSLFLNFLPSLRVRFK